MTTQTPDAVREARRIAADVLGLPPGLRSEYMDGKFDTGDHVRIALAALDSRAGDAGEVEEQAEDWLDARVAPGHSRDRDYGADDMIDAYIAGRSPTTAPAVDAEEGDDGGPCTDCCDTGITIQTERTCSCDAGDQYRAPAVDAVPAGEVSLRDALDDAINSPKGVVPVSAEPFYDGRAGRVKPAEAAPTAYLMTGRWELDPEGKTPGIYMDDPEGGDPICLCAIKRVYHPGLLSAALSHGEVQA